MDRVIVFSILLGALLSTGCRNECQKICTEMADVYDMCDLDHNQSELQACFDAQKEATEAELLTCAEASGQLEITLAEQSTSGDPCDALSETSAKSHFDKVLDGF